MARGDTHTPVLIAGGGVVGLVVALELGWRGVPCILVNDRAETATHPKANATSARSMEHYRRLGVAAALRRAGLPADHPTDLAYVTRLSGIEIARMAMPSADEAVRLATAGQGPWDTPEPPHRVNQIYVEALLKERAAAFPAIGLRYGWRLDTFAGTGDHVTAKITEVASGRRETIRADYLVGCDGGGSIVRKGLDIEYEGESGVVRPFMGGSMLAAHIHAPGPRDWLTVAPAWQYWILNPETRGLLIPVDGRDRFLFHTQIPPGIDPASIDVGRLIRLAAGIDFPFEILSCVPWTAGYTLIAQRYRAGRVFIAGDAAHLFTPTGGLGMNTGVDDAVNLGWKLAAACRGWAGADLLDSYQAERRPIGIRNLDHARGFASSVGTVPVGDDFEADTAAARAERATAGERLADHAYREFVIPGIVLGLRYEDSPIIWPDGTPPPPDEPNDYVPTARPGSRAPHFWCADGSALYDHFGAGFTLLRPAARREEATGLERAAERRGVPLAVLDMPGNAPTALYGDDMVLVRPDQHVAWRGASPPADPLAVIDRVRGA